MTKKFSSLDSSERFIAGCRHKWGRLFQCCMMIEIEAAKNGGALTERLCLNDAVGGTLPL